VRKESPIRIAYIVNHFNVGGLERYIARMCNHLPVERFNTEIICLRSSGTARDWLKDGQIEVHELGATAGNNTRLIRSLEHLLISRSFHIVQSHNWGTLLETYFACRRHRSEMRHIHAERGTVLGPDCSTRWKKFIRSMAMRFILPRISGTVCNAYAIEKKIRAATGLTDLPVEVIPYGLFDAMSLLQKQGVECRLLQIGTVDDAPSMVAHLERLGIRQLVEFIPRIPHAEVLRIMAGVDRHVVLQLDGPFMIPGKVYEMIAYPQPIVAICDSPVTIELVEKAGGTHAASRDPVGIANAIQSAARMIGDLERLGMVLETVSKRKHAGVSP